MKDVLRYLPYNQKLVQRAKELRKNMTYAEKKIWNEYLKQLPFRVLRQRPIDNFIVDFYCPSFNLVIEIDGDIHSSEDMQNYDSDRTRILEGYGLTVIRFSNDDVIYNLENICQTINQFTNTSSLTPPLLH